MDLLREVPFEVFRTLEAENPKESIFPKATIIGILRETQELYWLQGRHTFHIDGKWSFGSGGDAALAAMDLGHTAKEAVKFAATRDLYTGGAIQSYKLKSIKGNK